MTRVHIIGQGRWGQRLASHLQLMGVSVSASDIGGKPDYTADAFIIATPPSVRVGPVLDAVDNGVKKIRIEKPLALNDHEALGIATYCEEAGVDLTVGFTLLHHPAYYPLEVGSVGRITAKRIGPARHDLPARLDLGIHIAAVAAYLDAELELQAEYSDCVHSRWTNIQMVGLRYVVVDEVTGLVEGPHGVHLQMTPDPLERDLAAWLDGTHRGTPEVALRAQELVA